MSGEVTQRLRAWQRGDRDALEPVMPQLYETLRQMAAQRLRRESDAVTLDPTDLVNEAMARLFAGNKAFENRLHFMAVSALYMRSILADRAREIRAGRRPQHGATVTIGQAARLGTDSGFGLLALDEAMRQLEGEDVRASRVLELSCFAGLQQQEIAQVLEISLATVERDLRFARAWINRALA